MPAARRLLPPALLLAAGLCALAPSGRGAPADPPAKAAPRPTPQLLPVRVEKDIVYSTAGGETLRLDLAAPKEGGPYPAVVLFHGGAWRVGSRRDLSTPGRGDAGKPVASPIEIVAAHGYVAVSASYRLAPKHKFPAQVEDGRTAVRFLRANAGKYNLDPDRVGVGGFSAGGHIALMLGVTDKSSGFEGTEYPDQPGRVQAVLSFFGPTDLSLYAATPGLEDAYMVPVLGKEVKTNPELYRRASPIEYVTRDDPPVLLIHGTADLVVPVIHSERMLAKLREVGVPAELVTVRGGGHGWSGPAAVKTNAEAVRFLDEHLKGKK